MRRNTYINNLKILKMLVLAGLVLGKSDVTNLASDVDNPDLEIDFEVRGNPQYADLLYDLLLNLDSDIKKYIEDENLKFVVLEGEDSAEKIYQEIKGYPSGNITSFFDEYSLDKAIYVEGDVKKGYYEKYLESSKGLSKDNFNYRMTRDSLLHELGHFLDGGDYLVLSGTDEFHEIYDAELENFTNTLEYKIDNFGIYDNISSVSNYLASAFSCYISYPFNLKENCPRTYDFIKRMIDEKKFNNIHYDELHKNDSIYDMDDDYELNIRVDEWGSPIYGERLKSVLGHLNKGLQKHLENSNLGVVILAGPREAETIYLQNWGVSYNNIRGFQDINCIYVEGCQMPGYYDQFSDSSRGLSEDEFNFRMARDTLLHEIGHYLDHGYSQYYSGSSEFASIYSSEVSNFTNTLEYKIDNLGVSANIATSVEYFATAFSCYIAYPDDLRDKCPRTYEYYDRIIRSYEDTYGVSRVRSR